MLASPFKIQALETSELCAKTYCKIHRWYAANRDVIFLMKIKQIKQIRAQVW